MSAPKVDAGPGPAPVGAGLRDWVRVIGTSRTPDWLMHCGVGEFLREPATVRGVGAEELLVARGWRTGQGPGCRVRPRARQLRRRRLRLLLVRLVVLFPRQADPRRTGGGAGARRRGPTAVYSETLAVGRCEMRGPVQLRGRSMFLDLRDAASELPLFLALYLPAPPASVLTGLVTGATLVGPDPEPSVSRIAAVRVPAKPALLKEPIATWTPTATLWRAISKTWASRWMPGRHWRDRPGVPGRRAAARVPPGAARGGCSAGRGAGPAVHGRRDGLTRTGVERLLQAAEAVCAVEASSSSGQGERRRPARGHQQQAAEAASAVGRDRPAETLRRSSPLRTRRNRQ